MSRRWITLLLTAGTLIQTVLPPWKGFGSLELPVLTGLLICIALHTGRSEMIYAAVLAAVLHDAFCPAPLGLSIPLYLAMAASIHWIRDEVFGDLMATYAVLGAAAAVFETAYYGMVFSFSGLRPLHGGSLALRLGGGLIAGITVVPLVSLIALKFRQFSTPKRRPKFI